MIEWKDLRDLASKEAIETAQDAIDLESVSHFHYERRGRIQAGIKPAPPSTEPPSYARITKRGKAFLPDCRVHGKNRWCIHALILALHHLGEKPQYQVRHAVKKPESPRIGFQLSVAFDPDGAAFQLTSLSNGRPVHNPLRLITRERKLLNIPERGLELLEDLAEPSEACFRVARCDCAPLFTVMDSVTLYQTGDAPYRYTRARQPAPRIRVHLMKDRIHWRADPPLEADCIFLPGWPGFVVVDDEIRRYPSYVPDWQCLPSGSGGELKLTPENLEPLLTEKHGVIWQSAKPELLEHPDRPGLVLAVENRELVGRFGFWHGETFLTIPDLDLDRHILNRDGKTFLLVQNAWQRTHHGAALRKIRAPWRGTRFRIREHQAASFLERTRFPGDWRIARDTADAWYGMTALNCECQWGADGLPVYAIGGEVFPHDRLRDRVMENGRGVRLEDGRVLNIDPGEILKNEDILKGVRTLHQDPEKVSQLTRTIITGEAGAREPVALPTRWQDILRPYQHDGATWLLQRAQRGEPALLADDMGLGKTVQTLAYLDAIKGDQPQLVVAPASLLVNWEEECRRFCPHRRVTRHHGSKRASSAKAFEEMGLVITSYGTLRADSDLLYDVAFQVVVLDEAQAVKNPQSQTAQAVCELWSEHRLALTGTPIENRLSELWSIFQFLAPGYLGDLEDLKVITLPGTPRFQAFKAKVAPFLKRRLKSEVERDLPEKQEITVRLPLHTRQASLYQRFLKQSRQELTDKQRNTVSVLTRLLRLRQICCHPGLLDEQWVNVSSNKIEFLLESLAEVREAGHAVLIFSQFTRLLKLVGFQLEERELAYLYLDGKTRDRQNLVHRFQAGEADIFLISLKAGGTGLNLTRASYVYHLDPWWNPMVEAQATDRAHRIGQTQKVISYKLISEATIEEKILRLQSGKKFIAEGMWQEPGALISSLDHETLLAILD